MLFRIRSSYSPFLSLNMSVFCSRFWIFVASVFSLFRNHFFIINVLPKLLFFSFVTYLLFLIAIQLTLSWRTTVNTNDWNIWKGIKGYKTVTKLSAAKKFVGVSVCHHASNGELPMEAAPIFRIWQFSSKLLQFRVLFYDLFCFCGPSKCN